MSTVEINYADCLKYKFPNLEFTIDNNDIQSLKVLDNSNPEIPSEEEFQLIQDTIHNELPMNRLRDYRNFVLTYTDKYSLSDFPHSSEEIRQEWITFRQQLRDLTKTQSPSIDNEGNLVGVTWPTYPQNGTYP